MNNKKLTVVEHLEELRHRLIICVVAFILGSCFAYIGVKDILLFLVKPIRKLNFIVPAELFLVYLKLAILK